MDLERAARAIEEFLRALGHDPARDAELTRTGELVAEAFARDFLAGYALEPERVLADAMPSMGGELVLVRDLGTTTMCPHHLLPASGVVHVAYIARDRVAGLGAIGRLVDCHARRLTLQETMVHAIADSLVAHLGASAAGCVADLSPACFTARGERRHGARVVSIATAGGPDAVARIDAVLAPLATQAGDVGAQGASA